MAKAAHSGAKPGGIGTEKALPVIFRYFVFF